MDSSPSDLSTLVDSKTEEVNLPLIGAMKLSFNVKKQIRSKVVNSSGRVVQQTDETLDVTYIENGLVNGKSNVKQELIIRPITTTSDWRIDRLQKSVDEGTATDEQRALLEVLLEATGRKAITIEETGGQTLDSRPSATDEPDDVEPDYEQVNFADFGAAFLRGHGWKKGEGIGRTNKRVVPLTVQAKGRGFDLGISKSKKRKDGKNGVETNGESEIPLTRGVAVRVIGGKLEGSYGRVGYIDAVGGRCDVNLSNGTTKTVVDSFLQTISDQEYTNRGKVINKSSYDQYERRTERRNGEDRRDDRNVASTADPDIEVIEVDEQKPTNSRSSIWVAPELMVRVVSKDYKEGRFYKSKMLVVDAADRDHCELRDDRGRLHTLKQKYLETVIPKGVGGRVMIVSGRHRGQVGVMEDRDDQRYRLGVRVLGRRDLIMADFDDVCEFHGNLEDMDY